MNRSALSTAFIYGGSSAALMFAIIGGIILVAGGDWRTVVLGAGMNALTFGVIGFIIGFASHRQRPEGPLEIIADSKPSFLKRWAYRFFGGLLVGFVASHVAVVLFIGAVWLHYGGIEEFEKQERNFNQVQIEFIAMAAMIGAEAGAMVGGFLGAMIAPLRYENVDVRKSSVMSAVLGLLAGAALSGSVATLSPRYLSQSYALFAAIVAGVLVGVAAAIVMRMRPYR
jgi:hypothetical protein